MEWSEEPLVVAMAEKEPRGSPGCFLKNIQKINKKYMYLIKNSVKLHIQFSNRNTLFQLFRKLF